MNRNLRKPSFIIAGGQRCGTTELYQILDQHPEIYMAKPVRPEPKFFLNPNPGDQGWTSYLERWFSKVGNAKAIGEKSTSYMEVEGVPERMASLLPNLLLIFLVRNPVDRAISNYLFSKSNNLEPESFDNAVMTEASRIKGKDFVNFSVHPWAYVRRGFYWDQIERFLKRFPEQQLKVVLNDDLEKDAKAVCRDLFEFLGVDNNFEPPKLNRFANSSPSKEIRIHPETVQYLLDRFRDQNSKLGNFLKRDLAFWNVPSASSQILLEREEKFR